ncbi:MAG TPA: A/G-specific adenine glycosylase [Acidisarcina sp.]
MKETARLRPLSLTRSAARQEFRARLLAWFDAHRRDLPWRRTRDAYAIWVSEIMLQQTRVAAVVERYGEFLRRFPTLAVLAGADEAEVLAAWSGLGYYRRARMMLRAARVLADAGASQMPGTAAELRTLPGIGSYTSAAIASIAFGEAVAVVDGNVERVAMRLSGWSEESGAGLASAIAAQAGSLLDHERPGDFNQAMMELGATICLPRGPLCLRCPVFDYCLTRGEHLTAPRARMRSEEIAYALLQRGEGDEIEVLLEQRPASATVMTGMWELPLLNERAGAERIVLTLRHSIMRVNYTAAIAAFGEDEMPQPGPGAGDRRWFRLRQLAALPLTGLARKALRGTGLLGSG